MLSFVVKLKDYVLISVIKGSTVLENYFECPADFWIMAFSSCEKLYD